MFDELISGILDTDKFKKTSEFNTHGYVHTMGYFIIDFITVVSEYWPATLNCAYYTKHIDLFITLEFEDIITSFSLLIYDAALSIDTINPHALLK